MINRSFSWSSRIKSFRYALNGLRFLVANEPNARIHLLVAALVVIAAGVLRFSVFEWVVLCLLIGFVFFAEAMNTALEQVANYACGGKKAEEIGRAKDLAAGAVLISAIVAVVAGLFLFIPKIVAFI